MKLIHAAVTDQGRVRSDNQDRLFANPEQGLFIVSDGMGGGPCGALAAEIVVRSLSVILDQRRAELTDLTAAGAVEIVLSTIRELSDGLRQQTKGNPRQDGMGATLVLALVRGGHALIAHLGDSRIYRFRESRLVQLTKDHSLAQMLVDCGELSLEDAAHHPTRSQLLRFIGMHDHALPEGQVIPVVPGDCLLLCTDGLTGMMRDQEICNVLFETPNIGVAAEKLVQGANDGGGKDNVTVIVVKIESVS